MVGVWAMEETSDTITKQEPLDQPVCLRCLQPISPLTHYCGNCGEAVGQLTPCIPFVYIPYYASFFGTMWKRIWKEEEKRWHIILFYWFLIILIVPWMLLALPSELYSRWKTQLNVKTVALFTVALSIVIILYGVSRYSSNQLRSMLDTSEQYYTYEELREMSDSDVSLIAPPYDESEGSDDGKTECGDEVF